MSDATLEEPIAGIGDNQPPDEFVTLKEETDRFLATADKWLAERSVFQDADTAAAADDFDTQLRALEKKIAAMAEAEKRPLMDKLAEIRTRFDKLGSLVSTVRKLLKTRKEAWLKKEQERIARERAEAEEREREVREEAERKRREAEEAVAAANAGELQSQSISVTQKLADAAEAEEAVAAANAETKAASSQKATVRGDYAGKATGLKTYYRAEIVDNAKFLNWVKKNRTAELMELLEKIANTAARSPEMRKTEIPGLNFISEQRL
jgi:adenylate kinase